MTDPYDTPGYAERYDARFNLSPEGRGRFRWECETVERFIQERRTSAWLDVACGTGLHLKTVSTEHQIVRVGLDRSANMLAQAAVNTEASLIEADIRDRLPDPSFGLVTSFWHAYTAQGTVEGVREFLVACALQVASGGAFLLGVSTFTERLPDTIQTAYGQVDLEALIWNYSDRKTGDIYTGSIDVWPARLISYCLPYFESHKTIVYPGEDVGCVSMILFDRKRPEPAP